MKVYVFDLMAYGRQFDEFKSGRYIPYPLPRRYFDPEVGARTFEELKKIDHALSAQVRHMIDLSSDSVMSAAEALLEETAPSELAGAPAIDA